MACSARSRAASDGRALALFPRSSTSATRQGMLLRGQLDCATRVGVPGAALAVASLADRPLDGVDAGGVGAVVLVFGDAACRHLGSAIPLARSILMAACLYSDLELQPFLERTCLC